MDDREMMAAILSEPKNKTENKEEINSQMKVKKKKKIKAIYDACDLPLELGLRVDVKEITQINTSQQTYGIKGQLRLTWKATDNDIQHFNDTYDMDNYSPSFVPTLNFVNDIETLNFEVVELLIKDGYNSQKINFNMKFTEEFEVANFPFDVQDLSVVFYNLDGTTWKPNHIYSKYLKLDKTWSSITNWEIVNIGASKAKLRRVSRKKAESYEVMTIRIQIKRKWRGLVYRLISWLLILGIMAWSTFAVNHSDIGDRLSYAITMALTIVAFQFIISNQLPQVAYMTILDKYNLFIFGFVLFVTIETTLVGYNGVGIFENSEQFDSICATIAGAIFVLGNISFVAYSFYASSVELEKIGKWTPYKTDVLYVENTKCIHENTTIQNV